MFKGTPESEKLCRLISKLTDGVTLLAFSRGKDSSASWLYLRNYFDTIIVYTDVIVPGLKFVERSLQYFENFFDTKIHRFYGGESFSRGMRLYQFQQFSDLDLIDSVPIFSDWDYKGVTAGWMLAESLGLEYDKNWIAMGFSMYDSLDRMGWVKRVKGKHDKYRTFYPCWNWKPSQIREYIKQHGLSLSEDYLLTNRSIDDLPTERNLIKMKELYPDDYETCKLWFPMIESQIARQEFRKLHLSRKSN